MESEKIIIEDIIIHTSLLLKIPSKNLRKDTENVVNINKNACCRRTDYGGGQWKTSDKAVQPKLTHNYCIAKLNLKKSEYNIQKPGCGW